MTLNKPSCKYENEAIHVRMDFPEANEFTQYAFYLYNSENEIVKKIMYSNNPCCCFDVKEIAQNSLCTVKAFVIYKNSEDEEYQKVSIANKIKIRPVNLEQQFHSYIENKVKPIDYQLPFWHTMYPYQDILFAYDMSGNTSIPGSIMKLAEEVQLHIVNDDRITVAATQKLNTLTEPLIAFSGITRNEHRLIYGWKDMEEIADVNEIDEQIGNFFAIVNRNGILSVQADYFGFSKIYYYKNDSVLIVSNRYHLLLLAMTALHIPKSLNHDKVYSYLSKNNQLMMQNFTRELNIKGTYVLPVDSKIIIDTNLHSVSIEKTSLYYDLSAPLQYSVELYESLLHEAAEELIDNARVALESSHFENYIVDVTGGLDSRLVLCTLLKLPQFQDKIIPHTAFGERYENDSSVAIKLLSRTPFHFKKAMVSVESERDVDAEAMSCMLGTSPEYSTFPTPYKDTLCFPGFCGGTVGRPYYSAHYFDSILADAFMPAKRFYKQLNLTLGFSTYDANELTARLLYEECSLLPGRTNLEKYENHYLYYRNGIHFSDFWRSSIMCSCWSILQSKKMLKLKYMVYPNEGIKLQLDMLYLLNPEIAAVEFGSDKKYNEQRKELNLKYNKYPESTVHDLKKIEMLETEFKNTRLTQMSKRKKHFKEYYGEERVLEMLNLLVNQNGFDRDIAFKLYCYIKTNKSAKRMDYLLRKICSLYFELNC